MHGMLNLQSKLIDVTSQGGGRNDHEFVSTEAADRIAGSDSASQGACYLLKHPITDRVPAQIVQSLEVIQVQQKDRDMVFLPVGNLELLHEPVPQDAAIAQAGQRVGLGCVHSQVQCSQGSLDLLGRQEVGRQELLILGAYALHRGQPGIAAGLTNRCSYR